MPVVAVKLDFFGRPIVTPDVPLSLSLSGSGSGSGVQAGSGSGSGGGGTEETGASGNVWVTFHEGFSNAVRKPITLDELMRGF